MNIKRLIATASVTAAVVVRLPGCKGSSNGADPKTTREATNPAAAGNGIPCSQTDDLTATPDVKPPADVPFLPDGRLYLAKAPFGKTQLFFLWKDADPTNLDGVRDKAVYVLAKAGYLVVRKDQEGSEAGSAPVWTSRRRHPGDPAVRREGTDQVHGVVGPW